MKQVSVFIECVPVAQGRLRFATTGWGKYRKVSVHWPEKTREAMEFLRGEIREFMASEGLHEYPKDVPLMMQIIFYLPKPKTAKREFPTVRPDLTNYLKLAEDGFGRSAKNDGVPALYADDSSICAIACEKRYVDENNPNPGIHVTVGPWDGERLGWYDYD
jgi:Holliday junction resolvase RusA-like endonuclease